MNFQHRKKVLFFIGAGPEMVPGIVWAREMGLIVIATDWNPQAVGFRHADCSEVVSTRDVSGTIDVAKKYRKTIGVDGVMTLASDVPLTVAAVAEALNLPGLSVETARIVQDKLLMKQKLAQDVVPIPQFRGVHDLEEAKQACHEMGFPIVIKPTDNSAARGVTLVEAESDLPDAFQWSSQYTQQGRPLLIEEYLPGPQVSTETLLVEGKMITTGFADRNYERQPQFEPHFVEDGHTIPSDLSTKDQQKLIAVAEQAITALGIDFGVGKGDLVLTERGPRVIEIAARLSGGRFSTDTVPLATGVNIVKAMIQLAIGGKVEQSDLEPKYHRGAAQRYLFPFPGRVVGIKNIPEHDIPEWLTRVEIYSKVGDRIPPVTNHAQRAGYVITVGETREEAVRRAEWARDEIVIKTIPDESSSAVVAALKGETLK